MTRSIAVFVSKWRLCCVRLAIRSDISWWNRHLMIQIMVDIGKRPTIAGSVTTENNIRHYIRAMAPRISTIIQLGYLLINAVGHFMACLNIKTHPPLYKTYLHRYGFCNTTAPYSPPLHSPFSLPFALVALLNV